MLYYWIFPEDIHLGCCVGGQGDISHALSQLGDLLTSSIGVNGQSWLNLLQVLVSYDRQPSVGHMTQYDGTKTEHLWKSSSFDSAINHRLTRSLGRPSLFGPRHGLSWRWHVAWSSGEESTVQDLPFLVPCRAQRSGHPRTFQHSAPSQRSAFPRPQPVCLTVRCSPR